MPVAPQPQPPAHGSAPQHFAPPTGRELRTQSVHRLQVGLFGLCAMLLLVGLANIIMDRARFAEAVDQSDTAAPRQSKVSDPLADIGVVPAADPSSAAKGADSAP